MARPFRPEPEESGSLQPPRRNPPTAVGTATPPPRRPYKPGNYRYFRSKTRLAAYSLLASSLGCCSAAAFVTLAPWGLVFGAASLVGCIAVAVRIRNDAVTRRARRTDTSATRAA